MQAQWFCIDPCFIWRSLGLCLKARSVSVRSTHKKKTTDRVRKLDEVNRVCYRLYAPYEARIYCDLWSAYLLKKVGLFSTGYLNRGATNDEIGFSRDDLALLMQCAEGDKQLIV